MPLTRQKLLCPPSRTKFQGLHLYHFEIYSTTAMHPTSCISISLSLSLIMPNVGADQTHIAMFSQLRIIYTKDFPIRWKSYQVYCSYRTIWINSRKLLPWTQPPHQSSSGYLARIKGQISQQQALEGAISTLASELQSLEITFGVKSKHPFAYCCRWRPTSRFIQVSNLRQGLVISYL